MFLHFFLYYTYKHETEDKREISYPRKAVVEDTNAPIVKQHCILTCAQHRFRYGRMEYDTPSRFIRDIDPRLLHVESETPSAESSIHHPPSTPHHSRRPSEAPEWMQNPRPVATQFRADPKPRAIPPRQPEPPVDPLSSDFKRLLHTASGGRFRPVPRTTAPAASSSPSTPTAGSSSGLRVGSVIEHQRFGIGTVEHLEGSGDTEKATVSFRNVGTKQLLLKFARFKIVQP